MRWVAWAGVAYFAIVGANEFMTSDNTTINSFPDWGSIVASAAGVASPTAGALDLATAGAIWWFFIR